MPRNQAIVSPDPTQAVASDLGGPKAPVPLVGGSHRAATGQRRGGVSFKVAWLRPARLPKLRLLQQVRFLAWVQKLPSRGYSFNQQFPGRLRRALLPPRPSRRHRDIRRSEPVHRAYPSPLSALVPLLRPLPGSASRSHSTGLPFWHSVGPLLWGGKGRNQSFASRGAVRNGGSTGASRRSKSASLTGLRGHPRTNGCSPTTGASAPRQGLGVGESG